MSDRTGPANPPNLLKASTPENSSRSIVVSFGGKWHQPFLSKKVRVFFRKRGPRLMVPDYVYVYIGLPVSAIIGRAPVKNVEWLSPDDALRLAHDGAIAPEELRRYSRDSMQLCTVTLGGFQEFPVPLTATKLRSEFAMIPPQNFFVLSKSGKSSLDRLSNSHKMVEE